MMTPNANKRRDESGAEDDEEVGNSFPELLRFAGRAEGLISELLLLSDQVPPEFRDRRFDPVLFDLSYFASPDDFESRIDGNRALESLEDELRESCSTFMEKFFLLANSIVTYHQELLKYLNDLQKGIYDHCSLNKVLESEFGRQLLTESLTFFGCLLLLMEHHMGGFIREKLLVAHIRHEQCFDVPNLENICLLCRVHPSTPGQRRQFHSPPLSSAMILVQRTDDLFGRFPFPKVVVDAVIYRVRDDDLYDRLRHYPDPQHRTVALSSQAGYLYILLSYSTDFLQNGFMMREIVDRFFRDCWVVPIFLYFTVDLSVSWDPYREAKTSLLSYLSPTFIRDRIKLHCIKVTELLSELDKVFSDGILTKEYVLENSQPLVALVRACNVSIRWLLLHKSTIDKKLRDIFISELINHQIEDGSLLLLLLKTSQLELEVKELYEELLKGKDDMWHKSLRCASDCFKKISEHFSGSWGSPCKIKNESLNDWCTKLAEEVHSLEHTGMANSGRKLYHVLSSLKDVEQLHQMEENLLVKQHFFEVQKYLQDMVKALNLDNGTLSTFSVIADAIYAWGFVERFIELLNNKIEQDSSVVLILHSFFLKFRSLLDVPLSRIAVNKSSDLLCINYYSTEYRIRTCALLEIVPILLFKIFSEDMLQTLRPFDLPDHVEKLYPQKDLGKAINQISIFSQGIQVMSASFIDIIDLDIENWLEVQLRKKLSERVEKKFKSFFLSPSVGLEELEMSLRTLTIFISSHMHMMEYFQDLLPTRGNLAWEELFTDILAHNAQEELDGFIARKQEAIVTHLQLNDLSKVKTFLGRLLRQILHLTGPSRSMFIEPMSGWFDAEGHELLGLHFFDLLETCVGPVGMTRLDSLLAFLIKEDLEYALRGFKDLLDASCLEELKNVDMDLGPAASIPLLGSSSYKQMAKIVNRSWEPLVECLAFIGQMQLLRLLISLKLSSAFKVEAGVIPFVAEGMIASVFSERENAQKCLESKEEEDVTELFLRELNKQGMFCGLSSPFQIVYISKDAPPFLGRCASAVTISQLPRYVLDSHLGTLTSRLKNVILDFSPLVIGLGTFLGQFHPTYMTQYVQYMGQYVRTTAEIEFAALHESQKRSTDIASEVLKSAYWLMYFCKHMEVPKDLLDSCLPPTLYAVLQTLAP